MQKQTIIPGDTDADDHHPLFDADKMRAFCDQYPAFYKELEHYRRSDLTEDDMLEMTFIHHVVDAPDVYALYVDVKPRNCDRSTDGEHKGYWINKGAGNFRCYHCGIQFWLREMKRPTPHSRIEVWEGD